MTHVTNSLKRGLTPSPLLSLYRTHFPGELPPVLRGDAPDWVKEDFMRQALLRRGVTWGDPTTEEADTTQVLTQREASVIDAQNHSKADAFYSNASASCSEASATPTAENKATLTDPRLDTAPEAVKAARRKLRGLIPEASRLHMELVIAARGDNVIENDKLARRRARLVAKLTEAMDERDSLWKVIEAYLEEVG